MGWLTRLYRRFRLARRLPRHWTWRRRTLDERILQHVLLENEYRLPERFGPEDILLDIGAHLGAFTLAALQRGAGRVHSVEPEAENFALLRRNLSPYADRVDLHCAAVWRSDDPVRELAMANPVGTRNTGAHQVRQGSGVPVIAFDELIDHVTTGGRRVRLVKLDCEGAEWPILLTSRRLHRVDALCGEYHLGPVPEVFQIAGVPSFEVGLLERTLTNEGFEVRTKALPPVPAPCGLFFAWRETVTRGA